MSSRKLAKSKPLPPDDLDSNTSGATTKKDERFLKKWLWLFVVLILLFAVGIIVIIIVALEQTQQNLPVNIDVVLYENTDPSRMSRHISQAKAVHKYMGWVKTIYVLSSTQSGEDAALGVTFVSFTGTMIQAFEFMPDIVGISDNAIFLSDMTIPFRNVEKGFMFYDSRPRMFNIFREQSEVNFFQNYFEAPVNGISGEDTMPTLVTDLVKLKEEPQTWQDLVFREVTEERVTLRDDLNRDIFVVSTMLPNAEKQFDKLTNNRPLFATFHVSVNTTVDPDPAASNARIQTFLTTEFP